jgi:iron complex outermembrane receptor protein
LAEGNIAAEYGRGAWMIWGGGGGQRTGDYSSPEGPVLNSKSRVANTRFGVGWFGEHLFFSGGYALKDGRYGIPFADELHGHHHEEEGEAHLVQKLEEEEEGELEAVDVDWRYHNLRFTTGYQEADMLFESLKFGVNYSRWKHNELEIFPGNLEMVGTAFSNEEVNYRLDLEQQVRGRWSGTVGVSGLSRAYRAAGEEALSPPVDQNGFAAFALQELSEERFKLQFGGRIEYVGYEPKAPVERGHDHDHDHDLQAEEDEGGLVMLPKRDFAGFSGSAGIRVPLWRSGAFVGNLSTSYRAPALEELYNYGPHVGNLAFEIGDPDLTGERSNGLELSLRHVAERVRAEGNFFFYHIGDFIFPAPTGEVVDGLFEYLYEQGDSRFLGAEVGLDLNLNEYLWLNLGLDVVDARLIEDDIALPRIPPLRGRVGVDVRVDRLSISPELVLASRRDEIFLTETPTAGYGVVNLRAAYTYPQRHFIHHLAFEVFNVGDKLYRNHVSLIKDLAPEMGRGVRFSYAVNFF